MSTLLSPKPDGQDTPNAVETTTVPDLTIATIRSAMERMNANDPQYRIFDAFCNFLQQQDTLEPDSVSQVLTIEPGGKPLISQGDPYDGVYFLLSGSVDIFIDQTLGESDPGEEGRGQDELAPLVAPALTGEIAAKTGKRTATVSPRGTVSYIHVFPALYAQFRRENLLPELKQLIAERLTGDGISTATRQRVNALLEKKYPEGLEPVHEETANRIALLFLTLRDSIAALYTKEAFEEAERNFTIDDDEESRLGYQVRLLWQIEQPNALEANNANWHAYGTWRHTQAVGNAVVHIDELDTRGVSRKFLEELRTETVDGMSKYDLILFALILHDIGKTKPIIGRSPNAIFPSHLHHEARSEDMILRTLIPKADQTVAETALTTLLTDELMLTPSQITYIARLAGLHFEFGKVRRVAGKNFTIKFMESPIFADECNEIFNDEERQSYLREIGLLFLLDTAGKTPKNSWQVDGVVADQLPTDAQISVMMPKWQAQLEETSNRASLAKGYESFQTSRAAALKYMQLLAERQGKSVET